MLELFGLIFLVLIGLAMLRVLFWFLGLTFKLAFWPLKILFGVLGVLVVAFVLIPVALVFLPLVFAAGLVILVVGGAVMAWSLA